MFPFVEPIGEIAAKNHYTKEDIAEIIVLCKELDFELIPLIQTFGHLEFALKLPKFRSLREVDKYPTAVCPSRPEPFDKLIKPIIDQVIRFHKESGHDLKFIHIGCDEVFHIASCDLCRNKDRDELFLKHVKKVASYVKSTHQVQRKFSVCFFRTAILTTSNTLVVLHTAIIWHDMLMNVYPEKIKQHGLDKLVELMIWVYIKDVHRSVFLPVPVTGLIDNA